MIASTSLFSWPLIRAAAGDALRKFHPRVQIRNPVLFVTCLGAVLTTWSTLAGAIRGDNISFAFQITLWLWATVYCANFAEAIAEGRGRAHADSLRSARTSIIARRLVDGREERVAGTTLQIGDHVVCEVGDIIPGDGEVIDGVASIDESAITGESAPVIREAGGDRSAVTGGTRVLSDRIIIRITTPAGSSFIDRIIALVEGAARQKTPNEIALSELLSGLTLLFVISVGALAGYAYYSANAAQVPFTSIMTVPILIALLICLIPTTIGGLLSAIGISGMDRLLRKNVIATSGRAVEAAGDIDVLLLDKTGTITHGNRMATAWFPAPGISEARLAEVACLASLADETPEGRSIVALANQQGIRANYDAATARAIPFSAHTRMSGVDLPGTDGTLQQLRKGAPDTMRALVQAAGSPYPEALQRAVDTIARQGGTPVLVSENGVALGAIYLKDVVKADIRTRFAELRAMGIRTIMITGDNPVTAAAIAAEAGVDDFIAEATPETKMARIKAEQEGGHLIAMTGDGTNDAPALAQADVGVAMNTGTQAAREAGNMVDLDSNPTKLIEIVETGKQLLMTRGALTTFSIANDVAKYFAILPAMFGMLYIQAGQAQGPLAALNIMGLRSPQSAILSAVIFNALIIIALVPLALRGVRYRPRSATATLQTNLLIYGVGGLVLPFIGIPLVDWIITALRWV